MIHYFDVIGIRILIYIVVIGIEMSVVNVTKRCYLLINWNWRILDEHHEFVYQVSRGHITSRRNRFFARFFRVCSGVFI